MLPAKPKFFDWITISHMPDVNDRNHQPAPDKQVSEKKQWVEAEKYVQLGVTLPAATLIGWLIGSMLDKWLHTTWIYLAGLLFGIAAGFVQLIRIGLSESKK
jgi:F0F1-type ATP synthase assembly protein I